MAKDGTDRGGRRVRAGDKPLPVAERIQSGLPTRIMNNDIPTLEPAELESVDLPEGSCAQWSRYASPCGVSFGKTKERRAAGC